MGIAMNPNLPVLIIRDGSLLDDESRRIIADMAEAAHAQCGWKSSPIPATSAVEPATPATPRSSSKTAKSTPRNLELGT